jgi:hypothetical protein
MASFGFVEDSVRQYIVEIMNKIIREENLPFERADSQVEIKDAYGRQRFPDIVVWEKGRVLGKASLLIELKQPKFVPFDTEIVDSAFLKASKVGAPYFATSNMQTLVLFDSFEKASLMDRRKGIYSISLSIGHPNDIVREEVRREMEEGLRRFLKDFAEIYRGIRVLPTIPVDEFFVYNLRTLVDSLSIPLTEAIMDAFKKDAVFRKGFQNWFMEQGWKPPLNTKGHYDEFNRSARQYLYLLANKLMFYLVLKIHVPSLPDLKVDEVKDEDGDGLKRALQKYFVKAEELSGDYDTIFGMNFIERFPIPNEVVDSLKMFIRSLSKYDFGRIGYADLGKIFDKLIPTKERHKLGQYFTSQRHKDGTYWPDVVDLIVGFTLKSPDTIVLDGAVGAGTFLVRSYARMKYLNPYLRHEEIIGRLFGVDIAKFPALLSAINLAIRDLSVKENYPIIINEDFFKVEASVDPNTIGKWIDIRQRLALLAKKEKEISISPVKAFVGNPPYTRQEEMEDYILEYKDNLAKRIKAEWDFSLGKRCSIYVYFMLHGLKFLEEGGRLGYVTSNSWLDVEYGKYLQEFLLKNTKIIAVIESKVERWFEDADINTAITIAEKCSNEDERNNNLVKFVQLKKGLEEIIPAANENERWSAIDRLVELIESTNAYYEDGKLRIYPKRQQELWDEGYNEEDKVYEGSKWGKYLRAPEIFFKILEKGKDIFVPLREIAEVRRGFTTGANEFFYLTEDEIKKWGIENEFWMHKENGNWIPNYIIKSPRECKGILINPKDLKYRVLMIHKDKNELRGTNVWKYIEWGEKQGYNKRPTCASRERWYDLGIRKLANILFLRATEDRPAVYFSEEGLIHDQTFYSIYVRANDKKFIAAILNSTLINYFFREIISGAGIALGLGALWSAVYEVMNFPVLNPKKISKSQMKKLEEIFNQLSTRQINSIFKEIGATRSEEVSLDKVKPDRRELDKIIMGEILGLTEDEQLEVYRVVVDLVKSRVEKAKSVERKEHKKGMDVEELAADVIREAELKPLPNFPDDYIRNLKISEIKNIPSGRNVKVETTLEGTWLNVDGEKVKCSSLEEAKYLYWSALTGKTEVPIPVDKEKMARIAQTFKEEYNQRIKVLDEWLEKNIPNLKDRKIIREKIIEKILRK